MKSSCSVSPEKIISMASSRGGSCFRRGAAPGAAVVGGGGGFRSTASERVRWSGTAS